MTAAIPAPLQPRRANDAHYTPDAVARTCVAALQIRSPLFVVEPSVGGGAFARAANAWWPQAYVHGVDIDPAAPGFTDCSDPDPDVRAWSAEVAEDIRLSAGRPIDLVVGNPPYNQALDHVRIALEASGATGMLLRLGFLAGQKRRAFWDAHPPFAVHVLSRRPSFTEGGTDASEYAFYEWHRGFTGTPALRWLTW